MSEYMMSKILQNSSIFGVPLILYMVLALEIVIDKDGSIVDVYDQIFSLKGGIYDRCINNDHYANIHRISEIKEQIHQISREIALWMFENKPEEAYIPQNEYQKVCDKVFLEYEDKQTSKDSKEDFLIGNYFKQIKHCEGVDTVGLYFMHRTIYEYFVAEYIFAAMSKAIELSKEKLADVFGYLLKGNNLSIDKEILTFLKYKIVNSKLTKSFDEVNETFKLMICNGMTYYTNRKFINIVGCELNIFANMLEILHFWKSSYMNLDNSICQYIKHNTGIPLNLSFINFNNTKTECNSIDLSRVDLSNADLKGVNLEGVNLSNSHLKNACLGFAKLSNANFEGANLYNVVLTGAEIKGANLSGCNLSRANLRGAKMMNAVLKGADLEMTHLNMAKLTGADLSRTNLSRADLSRADLCGADLSNADLTNAILTDAVIDEQQLKIITDINVMKEIRIRMSNSVTISYKEYAWEKEFQL